MKQVLPLIFSLLLTFSLSAEKNFVSGIIGMVDGSQLECEFVLKIKNDRDDQIFDRSHRLLKYRMPGGETQKMDFKEIDFLLVDTEVDGKPVEILIRRMYSYTPRKKKEAKKSKKRSWFQLRAGCPEFQGYLYIHEFEIDKQGRVWESYMDGMGGYYLMREGEDGPTYVGLVALRKMMAQKGFDKQRRGLLERYFEGDADGTAFIAGKKRIAQKELSEYVSTRCQ